MTHPRRTPPRYVRTEHYDLQYTVSPTRVDSQRRLLYRAALKAEGGVLYFCELWDEAPGDQLMAQRCAQFGVLSRRPYLAGQTTDDSTGDCVWALYHSCCRSIRVDPTALLTRTYPGWESPDDWTETAWQSVLDSAQWQGITVPSRTTDGVIGLLMSLCGQGRRQLAESLTQEIVLGSGAVGSGVRS